MATTGRRSASPTHATPSSVNGPVMRRSALRPNESSSVPSWGNASLPIRLRESMKALTLPAASQRWPSSERSNRCVSGPTASTSSPVLAVSATRFGGTPRMARCPLRLSSAPSAISGWTSPRLPAVTRATRIDRPPRLCGPTGLPRAGGHGTSSSGRTPTGTRPHPQGLRATHLRCADGCGRPLTPRPTTWRSAGGPRAITSSSRLHPPVRALRMRLGALNPVWRGHGPTHRSQQTRDGRPRPLLASMLVHGRNPRPPPRSPKQSALVAPLPASGSP